MNDVEDIFKSIISYLMEEVTLEDSSVKSRLNYYIYLKNSEKGDSLLEDIPNNAARFVLNQRLRDLKGFKNWIDIAVLEEVQLTPNGDTSAKTYTISVHCLMQDDYSDAVFYKSVRMGDVLKSIMLEYINEKQTYGFMFGQPEVNTLPLRVSVAGSKALMSGITYTIIIQ